MRIWTILIVALTVQQSMAQFSIGADGFKLPPINIFAIYKMGKRVWNALMYSDSSGPSTEKKNKGFKKSSRENADELMYDEDKKSAVEDLVLDEVMAKLNITCSEDSDGCANMTIEDMTRKANISLDPEDLVRLIEKKSATNFDKPSYLKGIESKSPAVLPTAALRSSGWYMTYWAIFGVLLGLYLLLGVPYFLTGRTVQEAEAEEAALKMTREEAVEAALNQSSYMTYGGDDPMIENLMTTLDNGEMEDMMDADEIESRREKEDRVEINNNRESYVDGKYSNKRVNNSDVTGKPKSNANNWKDIHQLKQVNGKKTEEIKERQNNVEKRTGILPTSDVGTSKGKKRNNKKGKNSKKRGRNSCYQKILCSQPTISGKALSVSQYAVNILDWIPGMEKVTKVLNQRLDGLNKIVEDGRNLSCEKYVC